MKNKRQVKPKLNKETVEYIRNLKNQTGDPTKEDVKEFISYTTKGKLTYANFIAYIDACERLSSIFKRATKLHSYALLHKNFLDPDYKATYRQAHDITTSLGKATNFRLNWVDKNRKELREVLGEGSIESIQKK